MQVTFVFIQESVFQRIRRDLVMACHAPSIEKAKKQGETPLPIYTPTPFKNGSNGTEDGQWHLLLFLSFFERWSNDRSSIILEKIFASCLLAFLST